MVQRKKMRKKEQLNEDPLTFLDGCRREILVSFSRQKTFRILASTAKTEC
jgi:hypothetical protein